MSTLRLLKFSLFIALVCVPFVCSVDPPESAPSPPPELGADGAPPPSNISSPATSPSASPSPSPSLNSPPAPPPPSDSAPDSAPAPAPNNAPAPAPGEASDINHAADSGNIEATESSGGTTTGRKVGIAFGVIAGLVVVGLGAFVYKKRQHNIRRSEFSYAARREML